MEEWRDVPGRPGYIVSNEGRAAKLLNTTPNNRGYVQYKIPDGAGGSHREHLHQWVMLAFVGPPPPDRPWVLHGNDIKTDNRLSNLRYGSPSENMEDMFLNGTRRRSKACDYGHLLVEPNLREGGKCKACKKATRRAYYLKVPCTVEMRTEAYKKVMGNG